MSRLLLLNRSLFDSPGLGFAGRALHRVGKSRQVRTQSQTTTFFRSLAQFEVLASILEGGAERPLRVLVTGCSIGCEVYSLLAVLTATRPDLSLEVVGVDISAEAVAFASRGVYPQEMWPRGPASLVTSLIDRASRSEGQFAVSAKLRQRSRFLVCDVRAPELDQLGDHDVVLAQNFMIHMQEDEAAMAFATLVRKVSPGGILAAGGMDLELRTKLARQHGLLPIVDRLHEIHEEDTLRRNAWPWRYWALEPVSIRHPDYPDRYVTLFRKPP
jgi:hypothetical protein